MLCSQQCASVIAGPSHFDQLMSLQRWAALMGTGTTESNLFYLLIVVQHMPTGARDSGKGRPSSPGYEKKSCIAKVKVNTIVI